VPWQPTGPPHDRERFFHEALVYDSDQEFVAVAAPFLRDGLAAGQPTLFGGDERQQWLVREELGDLTGLTMLDEDRDRAGPAPALLDAYRLHSGHVRNGAAQIRVLGRVPRTPWHAWARYEAAVNRLCEGFPVWKICPYDVRETPDAVLADVMLTHPHLATGERGSANPEYLDPAVFLNCRARARTDPLQGAPAHVELTDPSPAAAGRSVLSLTEPTGLENEDQDVMALSVSRLVTNAIEYGRPPVRVRAWAARERIVVTVSDAGPGPVDPMVGLLPRDPLGDPDYANALHVIHLAVSDVAMYSDVEGFTIRLVQRAGGRPAAGP
jgi:anti-sigma regulatory factor (Ser/Thr protein kinase)